MKILSLITTLGHGRGGHFYDYVITNEQLVEDGHNVRAVEIGLNRSPIIHDADLKKSYIYFNGINMISMLFKLAVIIREFKPDVIQSYDLPSFSAANFISIIFKVPVAFTKCGGPNPEGKSFFPRLNNVITYSIENYNYFDCNKVCIPGRSKKIYTNYELCNSIEKSIQESYGGCLKILRISRIDEHYEDVFYKSIKYVNKLYENGIAVKLLIIGVIQSESLFKKLKEYDKNNVVFWLTDDIYTVNASQLIHVADLVLATGRGVMEAASISKPIMIFDTMQEDPIPLNKKNFHDYFNTNFSPRSFSSKPNEVDSTRFCMEISTDTVLSNKYKEEIESLYFEYFDISKATPVLVNFLENCKKTPVRLLGNNILHLLVTVRYLTRIRK
ncbi:conserved hypothetical protein [Vibrio nigripulchritudo SFn27]|uniref:Glycosyltransferase n=1 Tax=Vibrio nigripulchritudo TaxID=28173 RepID=U4K2X9_9VIBR|nr:hypothetical protein [Vibrio nigripulchritudo]CCN80335.1 conserved hypothetical protein [Vibrio nigripulchritudo BLFn1]CCN91259.1 conserved hypothetical protein [Vibrio nigripulchritudo SFn27]CCN92656.1 conserved hypothetical protein [Vibrio nigripulchritudo ENn2]CCO41060.1 conserved hypothetical protein [Vibrio nigripulchritudo SFn135]CCO50606.1 conserved hypothetical protein [Vibrio nigripulchritudo Wn13]